MGEVATLHKGASVGDYTLSGSQLKIIKQSIAPDLTSTEFDLFIEQCKVYGLNPITKQIYAIVYSRSAKDPETGRWGKVRNVTLVTGINGLRSIASRTGRYRPDEKAARFDRCEKTDNNPKGIETAYVSVNVQDKQGNWHEVEESADWDEFAQTAYDQKSGAHVLTGNWVKMPKVMIAKCAEARALRKAFPELEGLYSDDEMGQAERWKDATPSEVLDAQGTLDRRALVGERTILFTFSPMEQQEALEAGKVLERLVDFYRNCDSLDRLDWFVRCNSESLKQFWAERPDEALEGKREREKAEQRLKESGE